MNDKAFTSAVTPPKRQGFYETKTIEGEAHIAEWREYDKNQGKTWWLHVSDDPTVAKKPVLLTGVVLWRQADKAAIDAALYRELTQDEQIDKAVKSYLVHSSLYEMRPVSPPANRLLKIGDPVELGALRECRVIALRDDGRVVVLTYRDIRSNYGKELDAGTAYRATHWTDVTPTSMNQATHLVREPVMYNGFRTSTLDSLFSRYLKGLDDNPAYQRGYAWSFEDKQRLLESLFAGREIGRFMFVANPYPGRDEIFDGKQRLTCLWEFFTSQIAFGDVYWHELSPRDRDRIEGRVIQWADLPGERYSRADLLKIFLEVNCAGVPQTEEHLQLVRDQLALELAGSAS